MHCISINIHEEHKLKVSQRHKKKITTGSSEKRAKSYNSVQFPAEMNTALKHWIKCELLKYKDWNGIFLCSSLTIILYVKISNTYHSAFWTNTYWCVHQITIFIYGFSDVVNVLDSSPWKTCRSKLKWLLQKMCFLSHVCFC